MFGFLRPRATLTNDDVRFSLRMMVWEGVTSEALATIQIMGYLAAFALALGANNLQVGIVSAVPFASLVVQLPAILLIERFRVRKAVGLPAWLLAQLLMIPVAAVPFFMDVPSSLAVTTVIFLLAFRGLFAPMWITAWMSWMHDLVPQKLLGGYYGRRLAASTTALAILGLGASFYINWWEGQAAPGQEAFGYSIFFIAGALTLGVIGPIMVARAKEPLMPTAPETRQSPISTLIEPLRDNNFSQLLRFLWVWGVASNIAIPFFVVYMLTDLDLELPVVMGMVVLSNVTHVLFVRVWGPMADRVGSKTVMSLSASLFLLVFLGWIFVAHTEKHVLTMPLLVMLNAFVGIARGGIFLTINTLSLKIAPDEKATAFLGVASIAAYASMGIGPLIGGYLADFFATKTLRFDFTWISQNGAVEIPALQLVGFDFVFLIAFIFSLMSLNLLVALREEGELPRDIALAELVAHATPARRALTSLPVLGPLTSMSYGYLKRVPGADVALGVAAYQLAASTQAAVTSAGKGRMLVREVAQAVGDAVDDAIEDVGDFAGHGLELARHATRGAVQVSDDLSDQVGRAARGAVLGTLRTLTKRQVPFLVALRGAGYGVVQGAMEGGLSAAEASTEALEAARQAARELGVPSLAADTALATGMLEAAEASGEDALLEVREALAAEQVTIVQPVADANTGEPDAGEQGSGD
ncbi:MAG: MFS transporter [Chloroflexota bacterium]|nr:MFS transporter [Chloroflexota bacterium]